MSRWSLRGSAACLGIAWVWSATTAFAADPPKPEFALTFKPTQADVDYEIPPAASAKQCKVTVERQGKGSGWVVTGPGGEVLRRFVDSNNDGVVDQWRYYKDSMEVYRDLDTDFNKQVDQMRWFNTAGTRWGLDKNEDGKIDTWKVLSPEETSREVVRALIAKDERLLSTMLLTSDDLSQLGIKGEIAAAITKNLANPGSQLEKLAASSLLSSKAKWLQFQGTLPSVIPAEQIGAKEDIFAHQNAMTLVEKDNTTGLIQLGTLIRVGDVWKLTRMPQPLEGNSVQVAEDALFTPVIAANNTPAPATQNPAGAINPKIQKLIDDLQALDKSTPAPTAARIAWQDFNKKRIALLKQLVTAAESTEDREQWQKQIADGIAAGVQSENYPNGLEELNAMLAEIEKKTPKSPLVSYVTYRIKTADYSVKLRKAPADKTGEIQDQWMKTLESFVNRFPDGDDAPEAMFQLGSTYEFSGKLPDAQTWYKKLANSAPKTPPGARAAGALRRLDSRGEPFQLNGTTLDGKPFDIGGLKGKTVLVIYWANWSEPLVKDLPQIRELYEQYHDRGLEIVGINLDNTKEEASAWVAENKVKWIQIHEAGGLEGSPPAVEYGIIQLPTLFVVDRQGKVAFRGAAAEELKPLFPEILTDEKKEK